MIVVDIGNTSIHWGIEKNGRIINDFKIPTSKATYKRIKEILKKFPKQETIICSVVPRITSLFKKAKKDIKIVGENIKVPIISHYNSKQIGQDRLVGVFCARKILPSVRIVIDFGTAITLDILSSKGEYLGGLIFPGVKLSYESLSQKCALLPKKPEIKSTSILIPKNTQDSINKGIIEGIAFAVNALVEKYRRILNLRFLDKSNIIITGGEAVYILKKLKFPYVYCPLLVLKGLIFLGESVR